MALEKKENAPEENLTPEQKEIRELKKHIAELEARGPVMMTRTIVKPPDDYNSIIKKGKKLEDDNLRLRKVIAYGNINTLEMLIEKYTAESKPMLKRIATEIQLTNYDSSQVKNLYDFIDYLDYVSDELASFLSIHEEGRFVSSPRLRACQLAGMNICKKLSRKNAYSKVRVEDEEMLNLLLVDFLGNLDNYLNPKEK